MIPAAKRQTSKKDQASMRRLDTILRERTVLQDDVLPENVVKGKTRPAR